MVKPVTKYHTKDGKVFDTPDAAHAHEESLLPKAEASYERFLKTWGGSKLLKEHSLTESGVWEVRGEDPNCDMGGAHYEPYIATVDGVLEDVIRWAVVQDKFWVWGSGGSITKRTIQKVIKVSKNTERTCTECGLPLSQCDPDGVGHYRG